ncbi:MAG: hypothetical protein JNL05_15315 [Flavobacteriales bacterium]|nr:hypothetical protein [Flavobacteriales bacterium]
MQRTIQWAFPSVLMLALLGCGGDGPASNGTTGGADTLDTVVEQRTSDVMKVGGRLFNVPSPVQTALLFRKLGLAYDKALMLPVDQVDKLAGRNGKALAMGMFGADLAYATIHKDGTKAIAGLGVIERLSTELEVSNAFGADLVDRFKKNVANEDSLLALNGMAFRAADTYLQDNGRNTVSVLVLTGGWVESLYLTVNAAAGKNDQAISTRVGEQKRTLDDLVKVLEQAQDSSLATVVTELKALQQAYAGVTTSYTYEKPVTDPKTKTTHINSKSAVTVTPEQMKAIAAQVNRMRNLILA